jgi:hypothetical protein
MKPKVYETRPEFAGKQEYFWYNNILMCYTQFTDKVYRFTIHLGKIKQKNDGRFEWFYINKPAFSSKKDGLYKQGVCNTEEEAILLLEKMHGLQYE